MRRLVIVMIVLLFLATFGLNLVVLGSAGMLGEAAMIAASDALLLLFLNAASVGGLLLLSLMLWFGGRVRRRQVQELSRQTSAVTTAKTAITQTVTCPRCGAEVPIAARVCQNCGLARTVSPSVDTGRSV